MGIIESVERDDAAYFAPLEGLTLGTDTELYLGVVHRQDGVDGTTRRIEAARPFAPAFGIATECGIGRAPADETAGLLVIHAEVASPWGTGA